MLKMKQPTISFISNSSTPNNDEMVENDEPEEMEKLEYSESDDEDLNGTKNIETSQIEGLNSIITNSNIEPVNNSNVEDPLHPKTIVTVLDLDRLEGHHEKPHNILELKEKPDPSPNHNNNNMIFELATQKINLDGGDGLVPKNMDDKMSEENNTINDKPEFVNIENSKDCSSLTNFIHDDDDKTMTESTSSDAEHTQIYRPEASIEGASLDNTNISGVTDSISQNPDDDDNIFLKQTQIFNPHHNDDDENGDDIFLQTTQIFQLNNDDDSISRLNNAENDDLDKTKTFSIDDEHLQNDRLLNEIDEAISTSEGGDTNSIMEIDSRTSVTDGTEDSKSRPEAEASNVDNSFGKLIIDENNETDNEIETETKNPNNLELEESISTVIPNIESIEKITEPNIQLDDDDEMNGIQESLAADDEFISVQQFDDDEDKMNGIEEEEEDLLLHDEYIPNRHSIDDDDQMIGIEQIVLPADTELILEEVIEPESKGDDKPNENKDEILPDIQSEVIELKSTPAAQINETQLENVLVKESIIADVVEIKSLDEDTNTIEVDDFPTHDEVILETTEQRSNDVDVTNKIHEDHLTSLEFVPEAIEQLQNGDDTQMDEIILPDCNEIIITEDVNQQEVVNKLAGVQEEEALPTNETISEPITQQPVDDVKVDVNPAQKSLNDEIVETIIDESNALENVGTKDVGEKDINSAALEKQPLEEEPSQLVIVEPDTPEVVSEGSEIPANVDKSSSEFNIANKEQDKVTEDNEIVEISEVEENVDNSKDVENNVENTAGDKSQFENESEELGKTLVSVVNSMETLSSDECSVGVLTIATVETVESDDKPKSIDDDSADGPNQGMEIQNEDLNLKNKHAKVVDDEAVADSNENESAEPEVESKSTSRKRTLSPEPASDKIKKPRISTEELEKVTESTDENPDLRKSIDDSSNDANNDNTDDVEMQELQEEKDDFVEDDDDDDDDTDDDKPLSSIKSPHSQRPSIDSVEESEDRKSKFSVISKTMEETSADIPEEPSIKSIPKSLPFLKKFKQELTNFTTDELEELVLQKIVEALVCKSHISQLQEKVDKQEEVINSVRSKFNELSKLYKDLEMVHLRVLRDMDIKNEGYIVPVRITRAVGLQVTQDPKGKFTQTETTVKNLIEKNTRICYKPVETKSIPATSPASQSILISSLSNSSASTSTSSAQNVGEIKKPRTVQKFTPMRPQLTPAQHLQIQKQTQQEKQLLLQQQKQKILLQKQQQQQQQQPIQTPHQQTMQQKIAQSQQNIQRQQAAMQAQQQQQQQQQQQPPPPPPPQQRSPTTSISLKNGQMIVSRPVNGLSVTTTTPSSLIIKKATVPSRVVPTQSSPSSMVNIVTAATSAIVSSTTTTASTQVAATQPKSVIDLTDEEDIKVPESPATNKVNVLNGQPPALVAIPGQKGVNKLTYVIRNPANNNKILVHNVPPTQNRVTLQKVPGTPNRYVTIAPKHAGPGVKPAGAAPQIQQAPSTVTPVTITTSERPTVTPTNSLQSRSLTHPAPLPNPPTQESDPSWKRIPPRPIVRIQNSNSGIVISWSLDSTRGGYATIESYQIYAYQETPAPPATDSWRHVGDVKSMLLPMAVTLTHFEEGRRYYFAVRAVDEHNRVGVFSLPKTW